MDLSKLISDFFKRNSLDEAPVLVAFSGGPDSMALLHLLMEQKNGVKFALAHVDHRWRPESSEEARQISEMAKQYGLTLHLKVLDPESLKGNLEAACRNERLKFFKALCAEHGYKAVLMGHHQDDQAETVLKRLFEGSSLMNLTAMPPSGEMDGLNIWRPLLKAKKRDLQEYLSKKGVTAFNDPTNYNEKFLRARMRTKILPQLSHEFGKEIGGSLAFIAEEVGELNELLENRINHYFQHITNTMEGVCLDLSSDFPTTIFEIKLVIRRFCEFCEIPLSRDSIQLAAFHLKDGVGPRRFESGKKALIIHRKKLMYKKL